VDLFQRSNQLSNFLRPKYRFEHGESNDAVRPPLLTAPVAAGKIRTDRPRKPVKWGTQRCVADDAATVP
jgi:hypothetical protein